MGQRGPAPKPNGMRQRTNAPTTPTVHLPADSRRGKVPRPPKGLTPAIRKWWRVVWTSPMATVWIDADVPALERLARLMDHRELATVDRPAPMTELAEIRNLEDRFGLSPLARRRLQYEIDSAQDARIAALAAAEERAARAAESPAAAAESDDDGGRFLRVAG